MTNQDSRPEAAADLRQKAEALARERADRTPEDSAALSPEEIRKTLYELRVHQIELEMQNEELRTAQTQIEAGRERYFDLYDLAPVGYCTLSNQGLILEANLTAATLLGTIRSMLVKQPISRFILKEDQDIYYLHRKRLFETGEPQECELRLVKPDGALFWAHLKANAAQADDSAPLCRVVFSEITERKEAELLLEAERAQLSSLFKHSGEAILLLDLENHILDGNSGFERIFGYSLEEARGKMIEDLICPDRFYYTESKELDEQSRNGIKDVEIIRKRKDGEEIDVRVSAGPIKLGDRITGRFVVFDDITERKRIEEHMWQYQNIVSSTSDGIALLDKEYRYIIVNDAYERFSGVKRKHFIGREVSEYLGEDVFKQFVKPHFDKCLQGDTVIYQEWFEYPSMGRRFVEVTYSPYRDILNNISGVLSNTRDITDRKKAEEEREKLQAQLAQAHKMEAIGTLAGGIAHDFNNILSVIVGNAELAMLDVPEWSPAQDNLKEAREATLRARELVKQILLFARQKEHTVSNIRLEPVAKESIKMLRASIPTTVEIRENIEEGIPPVLADPSQIQQIIMNLCTNAGQVMEAEGGTLTFTLDSVGLDTQFVTVAGVLPPGQYVRMQVKDTGPGIPPEILDRIFDPFFTTKGVGEGTGLGLAVVHGIVQDRKGGITVESEEGRGTTFTIYLPASDVPSTEVTAEQKMELPRGTERVLFVDDEPMIMKLGQHMLERQGYTVETRASGTDALECFRQDPNRFDLVVTDMTMPGMRGDRLAEEILAMRPDIPVILCTGYSRQISKEKAREIGVRAFVMKPLTQHELANTVRRVLDEKPRK